MIGVVGRVVRSCFLAVVVSAAGCATVPLDVDKSHSVFIANTGETHFGGLADKWVDVHDSQSGFLPLAQGMDSLGARLDMAEKAEKSIDLQYFLMKDDTAGEVITHALLRAADRGVRIRFLLDDIFTTATDRNLSLINQHPNIEVRLFNPISRRGIHWFNFIGNFSQANRRMHNKSFTVDAAISIVGGRNIADEYFQLKETSVFADLDVVALGPIAREISKSFDVYWNHRLAVPIEQLLKEPKAGELAAVRAEIEEDVERIYAGIYHDALASELMQDLLSGRQPLFPANAEVLVDDPDKLENPVGEEFKQLAADLNQILQSAEHEIVFISPYYVPRDNGVEYARNLVDKGLRVVVATNSLASNNHVPVHSGYTRYRKDVIRAGVEIYETRADAGRAAQGGDGPELFTLHTKLILIDRRYLFVGSLNLDPRSIDINAEMGLLIDSDELTGALATALDELIPKLAYRVTLNNDGKLEWHATIDGAEIVESSEPQASKWLRFKAWFMKIAPESQL
jgi:putative cardiolipin synthase